MTKPLYFMVALWGAKYRGYFLDYCVPSLLLNESSISKNSVFLIACPRDDWEVILRDKHIRLLSHSIKFKWIEISSVPYVEANRHSARAFAIMTTIAHSKSAVGIFLCPDYFLANDMVDFINTSINGGIEAIVFPGLRISRERLDLELPTHRTLSIQDLPAIASRTLHREAMAYEWTSHNDVYHTGHIWKRNANGGMTVHCLCWSPLALDYSALKTHNPSSLQDEMLDGRYIKDNMSELNVAQMLQFLPLLAFQDDRDGPQPALTKRKSRLNRYFCHVFALHRTLRLPFVGDLHRRLFQYPAFWCGAREWFINPNAYNQMALFSGPWFTYRFMLVHDWYYQSLRPKLSIWQSHKLFGPVKKFRQIVYENRK